MRLALLAALVILTLACRTAETLANLRSQPSSSSRTTQRLPTRIAQSQSGDETPTAIVAVTDVPFLQPTQEPFQEQPPPQIEQPPFQEPPTSEPPPPQQQPQQPQPTERPPDTPVPPTVQQFQFKIQNSRCGPNVLTYIEGTVYEGNQGKNDVLVRISQGPDGGPDPNEDYRTGTDAQRRGYYYHNIDANAPHDGTWYVWVMDMASLQRISEIAIVKTDATRVEDSASSAGSCQSATVNFSTSGPQAPVQPTNTPRPTDSGGGTQPTNTPRPTQDLGDDST